MPSYMEVVLSHTQDVEITIEGIRYRATKKLETGDAEEAEARVAYQKLMLATEKVQRKIRAAGLEREKLSKEEQDQLDTIMQEFEADYGDVDPVNERKMFCRLLSKNLLKWDVQELKGTDLVTLDYDAMYAHPIPTTFLSQFWHGVQNVELVPKAKPRRSKSG